jgi:hypothetical protein
VESEPVVTKAEAQLMFVSLFDIRFELRAIHRLLEEDDGEDPTDES